MIKTKKLLSIVLSICIIIVVLPMLTTTAQAANVWDGNMPSILANYWKAVENGDPDNSLKNLDSSDISFTETITYGDTLPTASYGGETFQATYTQDGTTVTPKNVDVYDYTVTVKTANVYGVKSGELTINPAVLAVSGLTVSDKVYDGSNATTVTGVNFIGLKYYDTLIKDTDYSVTDAVFNNVNVGNNKDVRATISLLSINKASNYTLTGGGTAQDYFSTGAITQGPGPNAPTGGVVDDDANTFTFTKIADTTYEYKINDGNWMELANDATNISVGNILVPIGGLQVRVKGNDNVETGAILTNETAFTAYLTGHPHISGDATYGGTLSVAVSDSPTAAILTFTWKDGDVVLGTGNTYTIKDSNLIGKTLTVEITSEGYIGKLTYDSSAISKKAVTAVVDGDISKEYDGNNDITVSFIILADDIVNSTDAITIIQTGEFDNSNVGNNKAITLTGTPTITGVSADWYEVTMPSNLNGHITKLNLADAQVTLSDVDNLIYNGAEQPPTVIVTLDGNPLSADEYTISYTNASGGDSITNAGTITVTVTVDENSNYYGTATVRPTYIIAKATPTITFSEVQKTVTYDGSPVDESDFTKPTITLVGDEEYSGDITYVYSKQGSNNSYNGTPTDFGTYSITASINESSNYTSSASNNALTLTITKSTPTISIDTMNDKVYDGVAVTNPTSSEMTITGANYSDIIFTYFADNNGAKGAELSTPPANAGTYWLVASIEESDNYNQASSLDTKFMITQADFVGVTATGTAKYGATGEVDLSAWLDLEGVTFENITKTEDETIIIGTPTITDKKLNFTLVDDDSKVGNTAIIKIPVTSTNYKDFEIAITVTVNEKNVPTVSANPIVTTYTGLAIANTSITGTSSVDGTWEFVAGQDLTNVSHSGIKNIVFKPTDSDNYAEVSTTANVTIEKATPTGKPTFVTITSANKTLADTELSEGLITPAGEIVWDLGDETIIIANTAYTWTFTPEDTANYEVLTGSQTPYQVRTVSRPSSLNNIVENGDSLFDNDLQSLIDDNESLKVEGENGLEVEFDVDTLEVILGEADGKDIEFIAKEADKDDLNEKQKFIIGDNLVLDLQVLIDDVEFTDFETGEVSVSVPYKLEDDEKAENIKVYYIDDEGNKTLISSEFVNGFLTFKTNHFSLYMVTYEIISFDDVISSDWFYEAVIFAYENELMNGISDTEFAPNETATRAMIWTVLARMSGDKLTETDIWYESGQNWATQNGISDGTNPNGNITREELVTMIYRYEQVINDGGFKGTFAFPLQYDDADMVSDWAWEAMLYMTMVDVIKGMEDGNLNPQGNATRAEIATMLQRFMDLET